MFGYHSFGRLHRYALVALLPLCATAAGADESGAQAPVVIWTIKGDVHATSGSREIPLKAGGTLALPISIRVGADGALEMHQGATVVSAAANSQLQIPKATSSDQTLDRIVQSQGNVYYNVAKRPAHKLRVETPLLVAVIKGTRFNVSAQDTMTTISLLEGSIQVQASDDSSVVELSAGQMATRSVSQPAIRVIKMNTGEVIRWPAHAVASAGAASGQREPGDSRFQDVSHDKESAPHSATVVMSNALPTQAQTSPLASGVVTGLGDDHGASSSLTLNQLVTRASSSTASAGADSTSAGSTVGAGSSSSSGVGLGGGTASSGSSGGGLGAGVGSSGSNGTGLGGGAASSGSSSSGSGTGMGSSTPGSGGSGTGSVTSGSTSGTTAGNSGGAGSDAGASSTGGSQGKGNSGTSFSPGNSGITVTPGSGPGTSSASNNSQGSGNSNGQGNSNGPGNSSGQSPGNSLNATLQSLLNKKKK